MVDTDVVVTDEIGFALRMIDMTILGIYYAIIVTIKRAEENVLVLRVFNECGFTGGGWDGG